MIARRLLDPLYGTFVLDEYEWQLLLTPELQRLRYVRMCNINSLLICGASEPSRFEHSIGVVRLAREWLSTHPQPKRAAQVLIAAAILHDFMTGPFGHSLQYVLEDNIGSNFVHDDLDHGLRSEFHQRLTARAVFAGRSFKTPHQLAEMWHDITAGIKGKGEFGPLISGSLDLDNLDNVIRLAYHVGIATKEDKQLPLALARCMNTTDGELVVPAWSLPLIERWHNLRAQLYELLLLDWADFSAKAMLTFAIEQASTKGLLGEDSWLLTDDELCAYLEQRSVGRLQQIRDIVRRVRVGDLYSPIVLYSSPNVAKYEEIADSRRKRMNEKVLVASLRAECGVSGHLLLHPILDKRKTRRAVAVRIADSNSRLTVGRDSSRLLIGVFLSTAIDRRATEKARGLIAAFLTDMGLGPLEELPDPMSPLTTHAMNPQLELFR